MMPFALFLTLLFPPPAYTAAQFQQLRWLEGKWHGAHKGESFYQSFRFVNDSMIETRTYGDPAFEIASDSGTIMLTGGVIRNRGGELGTEWIVTRLDATSVHFEPTGRTDSRFTWHRVSPLAWPIETFAPESRKGGIAR